MIIGLSGYARSGKDTIAEILIMNYGFKRLAFADNIRKAIIKLDPILSNGQRISGSVREIGWEPTKANTEVRRLLQVFGTEVGREMFGEDFWVKQVFKQIKEEEIYKNFVITDVRFPNEANFIKANGGEVWRINRNDNKPINAHASESAMDEYKFDRVISNESSIQDLEKEIFSVMRSYNAILSI
jgi:dephospho-CoA kinase